MLGYSLGSGSYTVSCGTASLNCTLGACCFRDWTVWLGTIHELPCNNASCRHCSASMFAPPLEFEKPWIALAKS